MVLDYRMGKKSDLVAKYIWYYCIDLDRRLKQCHIVCNIMDVCYIHGL